MASLLVALCSAVAVQGPLREDVDAAGEALLTLATVPPAILHRTLLLAQLLRLRLPPRHR